MSTLSEQERQQQQEVILDRAANGSFDLRQDDMLRVTLIRLADNEHKLLITVHHIIADGWSMGLLVDEFIQLYDAFILKQPSPLDSLPVQYADFAIWQRNWLKGEVLEEQISFWRDALHNIPAVHNLPLDRPRPQQQTYNGAWYESGISSDLLKQLQTFAREHDVTLFMVLQSAFSLLLARLSHEDDVVVGTPIANRRREELTKLVGFFVNTLVIRTKIKETDRFSDLLLRCRDYQLEAQTYQDVPFEALVEELKPQRSLAYSPLFQVMFVLHNNEALELDSKTLEVNVARSKAALAKFEITLTAMEDDNGMSLSWEYNTDLFDEITIASFNDAYKVLLQGIINQPQCLVEQLPLSHQPGKILQHSELVFSSVESSALALFEAQLRVQPDAIAVVEQQCNTSYRTLNTQANQLAHALKAKGVQQGDHIGVMIPRGLPVLSSLLAIWKLGAVYAPIDSDYPDNRIALMLSESNITSAIVDSDKSAARLGLNQQVVLAHLGETLSYANISDYSPDAQSGAYLNHTSGSTGKPKGVLVPHQTLISLMAHQCRQGSLLSVKQRTLQFSSLNFDVSLQEILTAFSTGSPLIILDKESRMDMAKLAEHIVTHRVERLFLPYAVLQVLSYEVSKNKQQFTELKTIVTAGEQLQITPEVKAFFSINANCRLINHYGPSETHVATEYVLDSDVESWSAFPPIGTLIQGSYGAVLDKHQQPVLVGMVGELYLGGQCLATGYSNDPAQTAERFELLDIIQTGVMKRWYRTGDLVRQNKHQQLEYIGRFDSQVKLRGFRVELGEIENVLLQHDKVNDAVVSVYNENQLVAYYVAEQVEENELIGYVKTRLPDYMCPDYWQALSSIPLTDNGKVNRRALPVPDVSAKFEYIAPSTETEQQLAIIWKSLLKITQVSVNGNFFNLGGHSLLAMRLVTQIRQQYSIEFAVKRVFEAPTLMEMALVIDHTEQCSQSIIEAQRPSEFGYPLSYSQKRLWFIDQLEQGSVNYNVPASYRYRGPINYQAIEYALNQIIIRHQVLRTTYHAVDDSVVQRVNDHSHLSLGMIDISDLEQNEREQALQDHLHKVVSTPFDLATDLVLAAKIICLSPDEHVLALTIHHIACDGWSFGIFEQELVAFYQSYVDAEQVELPPLTIQYCDFSAWQILPMQVAKHKEDEHFWREALAGAPQLHSLPLDKVRPQIQTFNGHRHIAYIEATDLEQLKQLAKTEQCSLFMLLETAYTTLLAHYSGQEDIVIGTPVAGRSQTEIEPLIGFFVNTLVLRNQLSMTSSFTHNLRQSKNMILDAFDHQTMPFERLVEVLKPERSLSYPPLFQILFALQNNEFTETTLNGMAIEGVAQERDTSKFDLKLSLVEDGSGLVLAWEYNTDLFDLATIERFARNYHQLLSQVIIKPDIILNDIVMVDDIDQRKLQHWNDTDEVFEQTNSFVRWIEHQVSITPDNTAINHLGATVSYQQFNQQANQLARFLKENGVNKGDIVAICLDKSIELLITMLAVLKTGAAYLPIDPDYPEDRITYVIDDSMAVCIVAAHAGIVGGLALDVIDLNDQGTSVSIADMSVDNLADDINANDLAYVIYTSGSTGKPKGVKVSHGNIANYLAQALMTYFEPAFSGSVLLSSVSFDGTIPNIYLPLLRGGVVHIANNDNLYQSGADLLSNADKPLYLKVTPTQIKILMGHFSVPLTQQHCIMLGGEEFTAELYLQIRTWLPHAIIYNHYGPTETTIGCGFNRIDNLPAQHAIAIGRPIKNTRFYVLDKAQKLAPIGAVGELYVAGEGVTAGYIGAASLTNERYLSEFGEPKEQRMYRTGDMVRWLNDGTILFHGRVDNQIKLNGYRIETGEIEKALTAIEQVNQAVVSIHEGADGHAILAAFLCLTDGQAWQPDDYRLSLSKSLPAYMVPQSWLQLDRIPLTVSGKVDLKALPKPQWQVSQDYHAPQTMEEKQVCAIWSRLLNQEKIGRNDNFFKLGGHSLLAIQLVSAIRAEFSVEIPVRMLFETPVLSDFIKRIDEFSALGNEQKNIPCLNSPELVPVSFAQQRLLFVSQTESVNAMYNMPYTYVVEGVFDVEALAKALNTIVERHQSLRTRFIFSDPILQQVVQITSVDIEQVNLVDCNETEINNWVSETSQRTFDLNRDILIRTHLGKINDETHIINLVFHHVASDGWSMAVFWKELTALYNAFANGEVLALPELTIQYRDYAVWQREWLSGDVLTKQRDYWQQQLQGCSQLHNLPLDYPRPAQQSFKGGFTTSSISKDVLDGLKTLSQQNNSTLFMTLQTAFAALLAAWGGEDDIVMGTVVANRMRKETEDLIGFFVNTLVLRNNLANDPSFVEALADSRAMHLAAQEHQDLPFELLVELLQPERSLSFHPLFQVLFVLQNNEQSDITLKNVNVSEYEFAAESKAKFDLTLTAREHDGELWFGWGYGADLFSQSSMNVVAHAFTTLLSEIVKSPQSKLSQLPLIPQPDDYVDYRFEQQSMSGLCLQQYVSQYAQCRPDALAVSFKDITVNYGVLEQQSNQLARAIMAQGIESGDKVVAMFDRSVELVIAQLAILKAGAVFVPIDPAYPESRQRHIFEDSKARLLLSLTAANLVTEHPTIILTGFDYQSWSADALPCLQSTVDELAYIIYTSGTTGKPKGVQVSHAAIIRLLKHGDFCQLDENTRFLQLLSPAFDGAVFEIWGTLANGGCLVFYPGKYIEVDQLQNIIRTENISTALMTPALFDSWVKLLRGPCGLKQLMVGGDVVSTTQVELLYQLDEYIELLNLYGPTENSVITTAYSVPRTFNRDNSLPIGKPVWGTDLQVRNSNGFIQPNGFIGELCISGLGLAQGYQALPETTNEVFLIDKNTQQRYYRSGDLTRINNSGDYQFKGRRDEQVKLHGFRIELKEIESAFEQVASVIECVALVINDNESLAVYLILEDGVIENVLSEVWSTVKEILPRYMIPSQYALLTVMPLTPNGKRDMKSLQGLALKWGQFDDYEAPATAVEIQLCQLWQALLHQEKIGINSNFFELGGHSLLAMQLIAAINGAFSTELQVVSLFENSTVKRLATLVENAQVEEKTGWL